MCASDLLQEEEYYYLKFYRNFIGILFKCSIFNSNLKNLDNKKICTAKILLNKNVNI